MTQLTETQTKMLKEVLDQLMTSHTMLTEELSATHDYLFGNHVIAPFFTDKELYETVLYLRETILENQLVDLEGLVRYYDNRQKEVDGFFKRALEQQDQHVHDDPTYRMMQTTGSLAFPVHQPDTLAIHMSTNAGYLFESLYERIIQSFKSNPLPISGEKDLHIVVRKHVRGLVAHCKPLALTWKLSLQSMLPNGIKHYLEQFASNYNGEQVFVMQFANCFHHGKHRLMPAYNELFSDDYSAIVWDHLQGNYPPDYSAIINIIKREEPIVDTGFKLQLTEWLIYSKLVISHHDRCQKMGKKKPNRITQSFDVFFQEASIRVYGGGDMHHWIHNLFEERLSLKKWSILKRPPGHFWLTSDNPGFMINIRELGSGFTEFVPRHSLLDMGPDSVWYYPLSKDYCLKLEPKVDVTEEIEKNIPIAYAAPSAGEMEFVNGVTLSTYKKVVITNQRNTLKQIQS